MTTMTAWQGFLDAMKRLVGSMKFWTFVLALLTTYGAKHGLNVDPETYWTIVGLFGALLGVQGLADHGKTAAAIKAAPGTLTPLVEGKPLLGTIDEAYLKSFDPTAVKISTTASTNSPTAHELVLSNGASVDITKALASAGFIQAQTTLPTVPSSVPGFFHAQFAMTLIATVALIGIAIALSSCSAANTVKDRAVTGAKVAYQCGKAELASEIKQWTPVLGDEVSHYIDQTTGKADWNRLTPILGELKSDAAACALAGVINALLNTSTGTGAQPLAVDRDALLAGFNAIRKAKFDNRQFELPSGEKI